MQHWDRFVTYCKRYSFRSGQWQHFCSSFVGSFCRFWLLTTKFSSPAWTLFLAFSLLHSSGFTHTSQTGISPLQSITRLRHHHSSCTVCLSDSARNLGFILDSKLSMKKHIIKICQTAYFELKRISSIRRFLIEDATKTLVTSYILSRLDYCNCLLMGTPNSVIQPLQKIQNFAARLVLLAPRHHHATPLLKNCTGFPFQNVLSIKSLVCVSML